VSWKFVYTKQAVKDAAKIESAGYKTKAILSADIPTKKLALKNIFAL